MPPKQKIAELQRELFEALGQLAAYKRCQAARRTRVIARCELLHQVIRDRSLPAATLADWRAVAALAEALHPYCTLKPGAVGLKYISARGLRSAYSKWLKLQSSGASAVA